MTTRGFRWCSRKCRRGFRKSFSRYRCEWGRGKAQVRPAHQRPRPLPSQVCPCNRRGCGGGRVVCVSSSSKGATEAVFVECARELAVIARECRTSTKRMLLSSCPALHVFTVFKCACFHNPSLLPHLGEVGVWLRRVFSGVVCVFFFGAGTAGGGPLSVRQRLGGREKVVAL